MTRSSTRSLEQVAKTNDYAATLRTLRDRLACEIDGCTEPREVAALASRLADVLGQIESVKTPEKSVRDELAKKRTQRRRTASRKSDAADTSSASGDQ